jgi:hypothetical protein
MPSPIATSPFPSSCALERDAGAAITVANHGGTFESVRGHLFEPFSRSTFGPSGLDLGSISPAGRQGARRHADRHLGRGVTTFKCWLRHDRCRRIHAAALAAALGALTLGGCISLDPVRERQASPAAGSTKAFLSGNGITFDSWAAAASGARANGRTGPPAANSCARRAVPPVLPRRVLPRLTIHRWFNDLGAA